MVPIKIEINPATAEDYKRIKHWFEDQGYEAQPSAVLPPVGMIASVDGEETACAWLYTSDGGCGVGFLHFVATNPDSPVSHRAIALRRGLECIKKVAEELGIKVIFGTISNKKLLKASQALGWEAGEPTNHVALICQQEHSC